MSGKTKKELEEELKLIKKIGVGANITKIVISKNAKLI